MVYELQRIIENLLPSFQKMLKSKELVQVQNSFRTGFICTTTVMYDQQVEIHNACANVVIADVVK